MKVIRVESYDELSRLAADQFIKAAADNPEAAFGLATGSTPIGTYAYMAKAVAEGRADFSRCVSVNLDEYVGLPVTDVNSYRYFMNDNLFSKVPFKATYVPDGLAEDPQAACTAYDSLVREVGPVAIQLLGIGHNGHVGFNEPGPAFIRDTHIVPLTETTRQANARFFASLDEVPHSAITMGIGTIMSACSILLIAAGKAKLDIVERACFGPITPEVPASVLQLHPDVTVIVTPDEMKA